MIAEVEWTTKNSNIRESQNIHALSKSHMKWADEKYNNTAHGREENRHGRIADNARETGNMQREFSVISSASVLKHKQARKALKNSF